MTRLPRPDLDSSAFDRAAADFSRLSPLLWDPVGTGTVALTRPRPGETVLDACCGDGASAVPAALAVGRTGRVDAVDLSAPMTALALARGAGLPQLQVSVGDVMGWRDEGYDLVQCVLGVFFLPDVDAAGSHLVARAGPGGRVAVTVWQRDALVPAGQALVDAVARVRGTPLPTPSARRGCSGTATRRRWADGSPPAARPTWR